MIDSWQLEALGFAEALEQIFRRKEKCKNSFPSAIL